MLTKDIKNYIQNDTERVYPNECCGLIIKEKKDIYATSCNNVSETPEKSFIISPRQIREFAPESIIGFYHSHKENPDFSLGDIAFSEKLDKVCVLYCADSKKFTEYHPKGMQIPYVGRPFFIGTLDCFALFRDYYQRELNIELPDIKHPERFNHTFWSTPEAFETYGYVTVIKDYLLEHGFVEISKNDIRKHDVLGAKMPNTRFPVHIAIYVGNNQILHHISEFSAQESYNNTYKRLTTDVYRHKSLM